MWHDFTGALTDSGLPPICLRRFRRGRSILLVPSALAFHSETVDTSVPANASGTVSSPYSMRTPFPAQKSTAGDSALEGPATASIGCVSRQRPAASSSGGKKVADWMWCENHKSVCGASASRSLPAIGLSPSGTGHAGRGGGWAGGGSPSSCRKSSRSAGISAGVVLSALSRTSAPVSRPVAEESGVDATTVVGKPSANGDGMTVVDGDGVRRGATASSADGTSSAMLARL